MSLVTDYGRAGSSVEEVEHNVRHENEACFHQFSPILRLTPTPT